MHAYEICCELWLNGGRIDPYAWRMEFTEQEMKEGLLLYAEEKRAARHTFQLRR